MTEGSLPETIASWAKSTSWQFRTEKDDTVIILHRHGDEASIRLAIFSTTNEAMLRLSDHRRVRGVILSVDYDQRPFDLLSLLGQMGEPQWDKFPELIAALVDEFSEVYDCSDQGDLRIDAEYLDKIRRSTD